MESLLNLYSLLIVAEQHIHSWRSDRLTQLLSLFPLLVGHHFYILFIGLGYLSWPRNNVFPQLAFLIPYTTLLNSFIKNIVRSPRPQDAPHLISVLDPYGFPSGDAQVGTVFWVALFLHAPKSYWRWLLLLPILGIALSRVYFGVHRMIEVIVGILIGCLVLSLWYSRGKKLLWQPSPWPMVVVSMTTIIAYIVISHDLVIPPALSLTAGSLCGLAFSWPSLVSLDRPTLNWPVATVILLSIVSAITFLPSCHQNLLLSHLSIALKLFLICLMIFEITPCLAHRWQDKD